MSRKYIAVTVVCYLIAVMIIYILGVLLPYIPAVGVPADVSAKLTREAFSAAGDAPEGSKERALLMPTGDTDKMGEKAFLRRLRLISDAQKSIDQIVFRNYPDKGAVLYYGAILCAADRGVKVRLIFDGKLGNLSGEYAEIQKILQNYNNIELWAFVPVNIWHPAGLMVLSHDKVTVVDGDKMIVGGVNLGAEAYNRNFDMEVMITNSGESGSVGQAKRYFESMLNSGIAERKSSEYANDEGAKRYKDAFLAYFERSGCADMAVDYGSQGVAVNKVTYVSNPITDGKKSPTILQAVFNLAESSERVRIVTPYILYTDGKIERVRDIAAGRKSFEIITNSLYNTRNVGYSTYYFNREAYLTDSITLWEYQAADQLHAKVSTYDGRFCIIGSFNMDERSAHIDTESVLVIDSEELTAQLDAHIDRVFIASSLRVGKDNKYLPSDTVTAGEVPSGKLALYRLYNILSAVMCLV